MSNSRKRHSLAADDISEIQPADATDQPQQTGQPGPSTRSQTNRSPHRPPRHMLPVTGDKSCLRKHRQKRARAGSTALVVAKAFRNHASQMAMVRANKIPRLMLSMPSSRNMLDAMHRTIRDAGSNINTTINNCGTGVKDLLIEAMCGITATAVAGFQAAPEVAPSVAQIVTVLGGLATVAIGSPATMTTLGAAALTYRQGSAWNAFRATFGF